MGTKKQINELSAKNRYTVTLDDDPIIHKIVEKVTGLPTKGFVTTESFLSQIGHLRPLAFFVDVHIGLENTSGIEVVPRIKTLFQNVPVIVMTGDLDEKIIGRALECGADDFIRKPIQGIELLARFRARLYALREQAKSNFVRYADLSLEPVSGRLSANGKRCLLSPLESKLLLTLMKAQGHVLSKEVLKAQGWGRDTTTDGALNRKIFEIRTVVSEMSRTLDLRSNYGKGFSLLPKKDLPDKEKS